MQQISSTLLSRLQGTDGAAVRLPAECIEFYAASYIPSSATGFDPADAVEKFSNIQLTWNSLAYRREVVTRQEIQKSIGSQTNTVSLTFSNISRYLDTFARTQQVEGLWCVIRYVERDINTDSVVLFIGRASKPSTINNRTFSLSASSDFGNLNQSIPSATFSADDPQGRDPSDPLFEGIRYQAVGGSFVYPVVVPSHGIGRIFGRRDTDYLGKQWSSSDSTPYGNAIREILGRCQVELIPFMWGDRGSVLQYNMAACRGPIAGMSDIKSRTSGFSDPEESFATPPAPPEIHLGDLGGTGTNASGWIEFPNAGLFSHLAGISAVSTGSSPDVEDAPPTVTAIVKGRIVPVPDSSGVYARRYAVVASTDVFTSNGHGLTDGTVVFLTGSSIHEETRYYVRDVTTNTFKVSLSSGGSAVDILLDGSGWVSRVAWTDNPVHLARWVFTNLLNIDHGLMGDVQNYLTSLWCDAPLLDESNSELIYVPTADAGVITRYRSTSILDSRYARIYIAPELPAPDDPPATPVDPIPFDPTSPPTTFATQQLYRRRYTFNSPINDKVKAMDFLYKNLYPVARLFHLTNSKGQTEIKSEKAADNAFLRSDVLAGVSSIPVDDVTSYKALLGRIHIGFDLTTSENRKVTSAVYTSAANAITLTSSGSGLTATASGATLAGGSSSVQSSGTVTLTGTPNAGDSVTIVINGISITYTLDADSTLNSTAILLAQIINANPALNRFIQATYSGAVVTIKAKWGTLNLDSVLANNHSGPKANPTSAPVPTASSGALAAGVYKLAYSHLNALGETLISSIASITLTANQKIDIPLMALPAGFTSRNWYMSESPGATKLIYVANNTGAAFSINALPSKNSSGIPPYNSTGEESIRIALAFSSNSQGATMLAQSGLTRANITPDSYNYSLGSEQSSVNQIKGNFRDAKNDFALTPFTVNDYAHQAAIGNKVNTLEIDLSGVDNWHQAFRLVNQLLAKVRDCDWFNSLGTGVGSGNGEAILLEEGDVISSSDDSGGHVNVLTRIEAFSIGSPESGWAVKIIKARKYLTSAFLDDVRQHSVPLPTVNRYFGTRDSILELVDGPPIRNEDGQTPGVYGLSGYDESIPGDYRASDLYPNYGDGYKFLTRFDAIATLGVCTTTLPAASSPGWDRTSSLTVQPKRGELSSVTEDEIRASRLVNLMVVGDEYIQFANALDNLDGTYTISNLMRGCFGTDDIRMTHASSERFAMMDAAKFIPISPVRLNQEYDYKAVTINQDVADADALPFTFIGGTARTLAPVNLTGTRNPEGDLLYQFTRQARIGQGMSSGSGVPLGEEVELYLTDIYNGSTLVRSTYVKAHIPQAGILTQWVDGTPFGETWYDKNNVIGPVGAGFSGTGAASLASLESQRIKDTGSFVEAELVDLSGGQGPIILALYAPGVFPPPTFGDSIKYGFVYDPATANLFIYINGSSVKTLSNAAGLYVATGHRLSIRFEGTEVKFYVDFRAGSQPLYTDSAPPVFPYVVGATVGYKDLMNGIMVDASGNRVSATYTAEQQVEDFGSVQDPIKVRVRQVSSIVGPGAYREALL